MTFRRVSLIMLVFLVLLVLPLTVTSQTAWTAWLYESFNGALLQVDASGQPIDQFILPLADGTFPPNTLAVSPDGANFAYVGYGAVPELRVYSRPLNTVRLAFALPETFTTDSLAFVNATSVFSPDGNAFGFSYGTSDGTWRVHLFDLNNPASSLALDNANVTVPGLDADQITGKLPVVLSVDKDMRLTFALIDLLLTFSNTHEFALEWDTQGNTLTYKDGLYGFDFDTSRFATVLVVHDAAQAHDALAFGFAPANNLVLRVADAPIQSLMTSANLSFYSPRFVANDDAILVGGFTPDGFPSWLVLNGSGQSIGGFPSIEMSSVLGTPNGFIYTVDADNSLLFSVDIDLAVGISEPSEIWVGEAGKRYRLVWAG